MTSKLNYLPAGLVLAVFTILSSEAVARCDIIDVIDLVKDRETRSSIRRECNGIVDDAKGCSLTKVMRYANDGLSERQIARRCQTTSGSQPRTRGLPAPRSKAAPQIARFCTTPLGACPMMAQIPSGSRCHCVMPYGPVFGVAR